MSKKNNRGKAKHYVDMLREEELRKEQERNQKTERKVVNRIQNQVMSDIQGLDINIEKEDKMVVEPQVSVRKHKKTYKKQSRY